MRRAVNITVTVLISIAFVLLGVFVFPSSYLRFGETCADFGTSIAFYFCEIFGIKHNIAPSVNEPSRFVGNMIKLPDNIDGFKENTRSYFSAVRRAKFYKLGAVRCGNACNALQNARDFVAVHDRALYRYQTVVRQKQQTV